MARRQDRLDLSAQLLKCQTALRASEMQRVALNTKNIALVQFLANATKLKKAAIMQLALTQAKCA